MNILVPLGNFLGVAVGPLAKRVLSLLGLGYLSYQAVTAGRVKVHNLNNELIDSSIININ